MMNHRESGTQGFDEAMVLRNENIDEAKASKTQSVMAQCKPKIPIRNEIQTLDFPLRNEIQTWKYQNLYETKT